MKRLSSEEKMEAVRRRIECGESSHSIAQSLGVGKTSVDDWCRQYESMGSDAFSKKQNRKYSLEFKQAAVQFYLDGKGSTNDTCKVFQIPTTSSLREWTKRYNSHELKASPGGKVNMTKTKGRKTTLQERIDIVTDHIELGMSYAETAEKYNVSYQQVYQWIQKYKAKGIDGLVDRRGRTKPVEEMTEIERLQAENRILKAQLERKELENIFLKKVEEIERRRS
ncbi:MAG: helix-turn-helix domain-containing protein [Firmicutes bacterium]|nr:helix-turn-helix domain-containing protein [Bacillota bacterium]